MVKSTSCNNQRTSLSTNIRQLANAYLYETQHSLLAIMGNNHPPHTHTHVCVYKHRNKVTQTLIEVLVMTM